MGNGSARGRQIGLLTPPSKSKAACWTYKCLMLITLLAQENGTRSRHLGKKRGFVTWGKAGFSFGEMIMSSWGAGRSLTGLSSACEPYEYSDRDYFFGRDDELAALELQVKRRSFVAIVGRSGCGKSSLISAGLRPRLAKVPDHQWHWIEMRPGEAPIRNLALGLAGICRRDRRSLASLG